MNQGNTLCTAYFDYRPLQILSVKYNEKKKKKKMSIFVNPVMHNSLNYSPNAATINGRQYCEGRRCRQLGH